MALVLSEITFIPCNTERRVLLSGPKLPAALLAGHAAPHAAGARLHHRGKHSRGLRLHPLQGHLRRADAHRPASPA